MTSLDNSDSKNFSREYVIEAVVGIILLVLAFLAIASSDVSATGTRTYWSVLLLIFAVTGFVEDRLHTEHGIAHVQSAVTIALHWLGVFLAIQLVHYFVISGRIANANIGLTNGLVLALGSFLFGIYSNWRMAVIGVALAAATAGVAFIEQFVWFLLMVAAVAIVVLVLGARLLRR